jgi:hypothetical protein
VKGDVGKDRGWGRAGGGEVAAGEWREGRPRGVSGKPSALWNGTAQPSAGLYMGTPSDNLSAPTTQAYNKSKL